MKSDKGPVLWSRWLRLMLKWRYAMLVPIIILAALLLIKFPAAGEVKAGETSLGLCMHVGEQDEVPTSQLQSGHCYLGSKPRDRRYLSPYHSFKSRGWKGGGGGRRGAGTMIQLANPLPYRAGIPHQHQFVTLILHVLYSPLLMAWESSWGWLKALVPAHGRPRSPGFESTQLSPLGKCA